MASEQDVYLLTAASCAAYQLNFARVHAQLVLSGAHRCSEDLVASAACKRAIGNLRMTVVPDAQPPPAEDQEIPGAQASHTDPDAQVSSRCSGSPRIHWSESDNGLNCRL